MQIRNFYHCAECGREWTGVCGPPNVTMIVRSAAPSTCPHTRAKTREKAMTNRIALLNDDFRRNFRGGKIMMTPGVDALPDRVKAEALVQVANFSEFSEDNDPHDEHDFGSFNLVGRRFQDANGDPVVNRVLTIMLASEY
ncbi:hypothetical protein ABIF65_009495 [Bradyrhizobium japonicum]